MDAFLNAFGLQAFKPKPANGTQPSKPKGGETQVATYLDGDKSSDRQDVRNDGAKGWGCDNLRKNGKDNDVEAGGLSLFEGAEHERTADGVMLYDIYGNCTTNAFTHGVWVIDKNEKHYELKYGRIIALAGDYYSTHDTELGLFDTKRGPICGFNSYPPNEQDFNGCVKRFRSAVEALAYDLDGYYADVNELMSQESDAVKEREHEKGSVKQLYHTHDCGLPKDKEWFDALLKIGPTGAGMFLSLYAWLSYINFDHFGADAEKAYGAGHALAIHTARIAGKAATEELKSRKLNEAYLYEAFASHYLTDIFSSGHNRAPRRKFHANDVKMTVAAGAKGNIGKNAKEIPIWDFHCRYMHDDDSAAGLLVRNEKGDQWIQFGDKQLFEPGNIINRARVVQCLQASVDELWNLGFKYGGGVDDPLPPYTAFAAFKVLPKPTLSYSDANGWIKEWNGYDQHNIAPLWRAESTEEPATKQWTYRKDLNDHSKFARLPGSPAGTWSKSIVSATPESEQIRDAAFRGDGQFLEGQALEDLLVTGGFLQVQELMVDGKARRCLNIWGCANVPFQGEDKVCYTIRNRVIDFDTTAPSYDPQSLHWDSWWDGSNTSMYHFHQTNGGKGDMVLTVYPLTDPTAATDTQVVQFEKDKSWNFSINTSAVTETKLPMNSSGGIRFILGNFEKGKTSKSPDLAALVFTTSGTAQLHIGTVREGKYQSLGVSDNINLKANAMLFLKKLNGGSGQSDTVALASAFKSGSQMSLDITVFSVESKIQTKTLKTVQIPHDGPLEDISVLVGNAFGDGKSAIIAAASSSSKPNTVLVINPSTEAAVSHTCSPKATGSPGTLVAHHLTAVVPSAKTGVDLVTIDSCKKNNDKVPYVLSFTTHLTNSDAKQPFKQCVTTEVPDPLAPYAKSGAYFTIKWQRYTTDDDPRGIMEIFSFFGVLGVRFFSALNKRNGENTGAWTLAGQIPYMGQTSIGAGKGAHMDWGHGFMAWGVGRNTEFIDSNSLIVEDTKDIKAGFGFRVDDAKKTRYGGWDESIRKAQPC